MLAIAEGNKVFLAAMWTEEDTVQGVREFIRQFELYRLTPGQIYGDRGGLGVSMLDQLENAGWSLTRVDNGTPALNPKAYANRGSEIWFEDLDAIQLQLLKGMADDSAAGLLGEALAAILLADPVADHGLAVARRITGPC